MNKQDLIRVILSLINLLEIKEDIYLSLQKKLKNTQ